MARMRYVFIGFILMAPDDPEDAQIQIANNSFNRFGGPLISLAVAALFAGKSAPNGPMRRPG